LSTITKKYKNIYQSSTNLFSNPSDISFLEKISSTLASNKRRKRSVNQNNYLMAKPMKNSASKTPAFINSFALSTLEHIKSFVTKCMPSYLFGHVNDNQRLAKQNENYPITSSYHVTEKNSFSSMVDFNYLLILLDLFARKVTKVKSSSNFIQPDFHWLEAQATALNIVEAAENRWTRLHHDNMSKNFEYDFVSLHKNVTKKILQLDDYGNLDTIIEETIKMVDEHYILSE
jgi:hypothetical protein